MGSTLPSADALPVRREATPAFRVAKAIARPVFHAVFDIQVEGREHIPTGPYVLIANHLNWPDYWLLLLCFPTEPRLHFLANPANLVKHPLHWAIVRAVGGYIPVDLRRQAGPALFRQVDRCLEVGGVVAIFPEAAYGPAEGRLQETFKAGFAHFAVNNRVPVLPVALSGTKDLWLRKRIRLTIGGALPAGDDPDALLERSRVALTGLLQPYAEPAGPKPLRKFLTNLLY